ncbi:MAG: antibiotic biosynthesis monooxygenase [Actinomycetota bacterium]|nr:antibiotic biosynthesis monooxygenase [Actinomycetota bacterium]
MISVTHFQAREDSFAERGATALRALARRPGYLSGKLARSTDSLDRWVLITEWENVGSYRRALGAFEVKLRATELFGAAVGSPDLPSAFEALVEALPGGEAVLRPSDHE